MSILAEWYTGNASNWKRFFIPTYAGALRQLKTGDQVLIPYELATKFTPPTEGFIRYHKKPAETDDARAVKKTKRTTTETPSPSELEHEFLNQMVSKGEKQFPD